MASLFFILSIVSGVMGAAFMSDGERTGDRSLSKTGGGLFCFAAAFLVMALLITIAGVLNK